METVFPVLIFLAVSLTSHQSASRIDDNTNNVYVGKRGPLSSEVKYAVLHHSQVRASFRPRQLYMVNDYHKKKFGSKSSLGWWVGYNWFCDVDGTLTQTRLVGERTAAQQRHNLDSDSICLAGDFNIDLPTEAQIKVLRRWIAVRTHLLFRFHRDLALRTCPGKNITKEWIRAAVVEGNELPTRQARRSVQTKAPDHSDFRERIRLELKKRGYDLP